MQPRALCKGGQDGDLLLMNCPALVSRPHFDVHEQPMYPSTSGTITTRCLALSWMAATMTVLNYEMPSSATLLRGTISTHTT